MHVSKQNKVLIDADKPASIILFDKNKIIILILIFFLLIIFNYLVSDKISAILGLEGYKKSFSDMNNLAIISALVIAPIIEESIFRYSLLRGNNYKFFIYISFCLIIVLFINIWIGVILLFGFSVLSFLYFYFLKTESKLRFIFFIILSAITFSIMHIPAINGETIWINTLVVSVSLFPIGLFFCLVRSDFGFEVAILAHFTYNLLTLSFNEIIY